MTQTLQLTAMTLGKSVADWQQHIKKELSSIGYEVLQTGKSLTCYKTTWRTSSKNQGAVDAYAVTKVWAANEQTNIGITPKRVYLNHNGTLDQRQEWVILGSQTRPPSDRKLILERLKGLLHDLSSAGGIKEPLATVFLRTKDIAIDQAEIHYEPAAATSLKLCFVAETNDCQIALRDFANKLSLLLTKRNIVLEPLFVDINKLRTRLIELKEQGSLPEKPIPIFLMLRSKFHPADHSLIELLTLLDKTRVPWRRAYKEDDRRWSIRDQMGSIMRAAGLRDRRVTINKAPLPWSIGIDLAHPSATCSVLCTALTDPSGNLVEAWVKPHKKSEKISPAAIKGLLSSARQHVASLDENAKILIIRDGRLTDKELASTYLEGFSSKTAMIELRKRGNPIIIDKDTPSIPNSPISLSVKTESPNTHVVFSCTNPHVKFGFPQILKFHWRDDWVGSEWTSDDILITTQALCSAPGLGNGQHTLPAPIYWADGIAGASDTDLRFRGHNATNL